MNAKFQSQILHDRPALNRWIAWRVKLHARRQAAVARAVFRSTRGRA